MSRNLAYDVPARLAQLGIRALTDADVDGVLTEAIRFVRDSVGAAYAEVLELDRNDRTLRLRASAGRPPGSGAGGSGTGGVRPVGSRPVDRATLAAQRPLHWPDLVVTAGSGYGLTVALHGPDGVLGMLGAYRESGSSFSDGDMLLLQGVANLVAGTLTRHRVEDAMRWHSELDRLLTTVSTRFIHLPAAQIEGGLADALELIGSFVGAECGYVFLVEPGGGALHCAAKWQAPGQPVKLPGLPLASMPSWLGQLERGDVIILPGPGELTGPAAGSAVVLPLLGGDGLLGFARFDAVAGSGRWQPEIVGQLRTLGDIMAGGVARQQVAAELTASELRYRAVVDDVAEVIVRIGPDGRLSFVNRAWTELTGLSFEETVGRDPLESLHPDDRLIAAEHMAAAIRGEPDATREVRFVARDCSLRWMEVRGRALHDADGALAGFSGTMHDVTERRAAEDRALAARDEAEHARELAERASRAKSEFLSRMSHELRTPLNAILGFSQLLQLAELGEEDVDNVAHVLHAGRHLLDLINDALDISRIETGRLPVTLGPVGVISVTTESMDMLRPAADQRGLRTTALTAPEASGYVLADRQRLKQVLVNLLSNAVKYNREHGEIIVECRPLPVAEAPAGPATPGESGWLRITVTDTGMGIPANRIDEVFVPFERLGAELTEVEGTGIGLSLAKSLVEAMHGRIGVASTEGVGSTFFVDLPATPHPALTAAGKVPASGEAGPMRTVIYLEDNPPNVTLVRRVLARRPGVRLMVDTDGHTGLATIRRERPDLVLLDLHLPYLDGGQVLAALRADDDPALRATPVVLVTADLAAEVEQQLLAAGADAFLGKPLDVPELLAVVDRYLLLNDAISEWGDPI